MIGYQLLIIFALLIIILIQKLQHLSELQDYKRTNTDLLNRVMAQSLYEYQQGNYIAKKEHDAPVSSKERIKQSQVDQDREEWADDEIINVTG